MKIVFFWSKSQNRIIARCKQCGTDVDINDIESLKSHRCDMDSLHPLKYNCQGAYMAGVKMHPEEDMVNLGLTIMEWCPEPIADSIFIKARGDISNLPEYITLAPKYFENESRRGQTI